MGKKPQEAADLVLYEVYQELAESESKESEYETSETFFAEEREAYFQSSEIPEQLPFNHSTTNP